MSKRIKTDSDMFQNNEAIDAAYDLLFILKRLKDSINNWIIFQEDEIDSFYSQVELEFTGIIAVNMLNLHFQRLNEEGKRDISGRISSLLIDEMKNLVLLEKHYSYRRDKIMKFNDPLLLSRLIEVKMMLKNNWLYPNAKIEGNPITDFIKGTLIGKSNNFSITWLQQQLKLFAYYSQKKGS